MMLTFLCGGLVGLNAIVVEMVFPRRWLQLSIAAKFFELPSPVSAAQEDKSSFQEFSSPLLSTVVLIESDNTENNSPAGEKKNILIKFLNDRFIVNLKELNRSEEQFVEGREMLMKIIQQNVLSTQSIA